jgi:methylated-DNA-protein-cysteine methyltransferase-like protein
MEDSRTSPQVRTTSAFYRQVYALVRTIPVGKLTTYGTIALALGAPRRARHVGNALAALPDDHDVPAQRVVNRSGTLTGGWHFGHPNRQNPRPSICHAS